MQTVPELCKCVDSPCITIAYEDGGGAESVQLSSITPAIFACSPLEEGRIQVLDLLPGDYLEHFVCELRCVNIADSSEHTILVIGLGKDAAQKVISVDSADILTTPNLDCRLETYSNAIESYHSRSRSIYSKDQAGREQRDGPCQNTICLCPQTKKSC